MATRPLRTRTVLAVSTGNSGSAESSRPRFFRSSPQLKHSRSGTAVNLSPSRYTRHRYFMCHSLFLPWARSLDGLFRRLSFGRFLRARLFSLDLRDLRGSEVVRFL